MNKFAYYDLPFKPENRSTQNCLEPDQHSNKVTQKLCGKSCYLPRLVYLSQDIVDVPSTKSPTKILPGFLSWSQAGTSSHVKLGW